ncbi:hypothetical protein [Flavobacterium frigoris]|uniref:Uncharacterized protein n=1 Tax=Flavobacterium frigoris TaxID=229204 RepID=A0A1H9MXD3_FLAFI|nr:hypothetical protein [Flavobacterium frigoris]SER27753.1 hypothetical protein SAMN05444355_10938 [Flavobacterium frigoris]
MELYNYINRFKKKTIKDNTIELVEDEFILNIVFDRKIDEDAFFISEFKNKIQKAVIRKYKSEHTGFVKSLYSLLNVCYLQTNKIPKYNLGQEANDSSKIFFEVFLQIDDSFSEHNVTSILLKTKEVVEQKSNPFYLEHHLVESNKIVIIQSNTKTRRLGYLKLIIELFEHSNYFPISYLSKRIETDSTLYNEDLLEYGKHNTGDNKGLIKKTPIGSSAQPYVNLLEELNLVTQINNSYILTKQSKIYFHLNKIFTQNKNLFRLNILDKLFFFRQILISDSLYIWTIIDIIYIAQKPISTISIKKVFVDYVKNELELNQQYSNNNITKKQIIELKTRISSWTKPLVYLEHIIEPRVNWLMDLGLLELKTETKEKQYFFTKEGLNLVRILFQLFEKNLNKQLVLNSFISKNYFHVFNDIFDLNKNSTILNYRKIDQYILEAFKVFKTNAPNKIAASQGIDYVCFKAFLEDNMIIEFEELKKYLQEPNDKFSIDWFNTENDGALYLKKIN